MGAAGKVISSDFYLSSVREETTPTGQQLLKLVLSDGFGHVLGFVWPENRKKVGAPCPGSVYRIHGFVQSFNDRAQIRIYQLESLEAQSITMLTRLLPMDLFDHPTGNETRAALERLEQGLPDPLDSFLRRVLLDPRIGPDFLKTRGSVHHHHSHVGGLAAHSTEMLEHAYILTRQTLPDDEWSPHIAALGYLLHDVGKIKTVGTYRRPPHAFVLSHEYWNVELLAPHLEWLERRQSDLAMGLRTILEYVVTPAKARQPECYFPAKVVVDLDSSSAAKYNQRSLSNLIRRCGARPTQS